MNKDRVLKSGRGYAAGLAIVLVIALLARLPLINVSSDSYRLTSAFNPEEVENVRISTGMLHKHSFNPHAFEYPSLFYYLSLAPEAILDSADYDSWPKALVGVRLLSLLFSLGAVIAAGTLARRLGGNSAGLFAAAVMALDRTQIEIAALAKPNAAQVCLALCAFVALAALSVRPTAARAASAAALLALATAAKWLGALGLGLLALAPLLSQPTAAPRGAPRLMGSARTALSIRLPVLGPLLPALVFAVVFLACVPYAVLSPREFAAGLGVVFSSQSLHVRELPAWMPLHFALHSMGPVAGLAAGVALLWGLVRVALWDGSTQDRGVALLVAWTLGYGALLTFVFVRLPNYVDLWVPPLAVLAGCAWAGDRGLFRGRMGRLATWLVVAAGLVANGGYAAARVRLTWEFDTRAAAGLWLERAAGDSDSVLADAGSYVPDRLTHVQWNSWGGPPRAIYDETRTWGWDPVWPEWDGGHRRLLFENAKWRAPGERLAQRPRWVIVSDEWRAARAHPSYAAEFADSAYDRSLADGSAGYAKRAQFVPAPPPSSPWAVLLLEKRRHDSGPYYNGPEITIYQRASGSPGD